MPKNEDRVRRDLEVLGLELTASEDDKRKAFIKLALKLHPDRFNKSPDDAIKMKFHEVCKAYKRLTSDHCSTADWNIDKSNEIFFSLLADSLQHNSKAALYGLFTELPNHKSHFQNDNEYRCKEDAFDDEEDEDTEFNRLITILTNRLQNGKSLPAGLTQDKICKLKEDFIKHKEASKKCTEDGKSTATTKKPKPPLQVPVTKPKPKSKKQILAEQRRREKEMAKIAAELDEKKKKEEEKETARRQLEEEKQRKMEKEQKKLEEERKRQASQAKKRKEREDRERELRQQKENERLEKLKKQQEEELRRKEEEKKRKAEEKAAKSKALRDAKEKEEKEKQEQSKRQQASKRPPANGQQYQPQYQQYQQQQQKYPREVPPRFLRQMQQRQQPAAQSDSEEQTPKSQSATKDGKTAKEEADWDNSNDEASNVPQNTVETRSQWTDGSNVANENWGQELSSGTGSLSDWGTANATEDWDAPSESGLGSNWTEQKALISDNGGINDTPSIGTIGSELKSGRIPKKETPLLTNSNEKSGSGQFGAIGQPLAPVKEISSEVIPFKEKEVELEKNLAMEQLYKDVIGKNTSSEVKDESLKTAKNSGPKNVDASKLQESKITSPKLTGWSGLDGFEPLPNFDSSANAASRSGPVVADSNAKVKAKQEQTIVNTGKNSSHVVSGKEVQKDVGLDKITLTTTDKSSNAAGLETSRGTADEWGWTTASSKKAKKPTPATPANSDANVWMNRSLKQLIDMGFKLEDAERALKENNGIIESAVSDLLSRTDTQPNDAKLQEQNRTEEPVRTTAKESVESDEKQSIRKSKINENNSTSDSGKLKSTQRTAKEGGDNFAPASANDLLSKPKPINSMPNSSFIATDHGQCFPETPKTKPVGVIGGQLSSSLSKATSQGSPRSSDDSGKLLSSRPIQAQASSQSSLHHISTPGSQITSSSLHQPVFSNFSSEPQSSRIHQMLQQQPMSQIRPHPPNIPVESSHNLPQSLFPQAPILSSAPGTVPSEPSFIPSALAANPNPAPQQSKLLKWAQSISMDTKETSVSAASGEMERSWSGTNPAADTSSTSIAPIGAPVTVDPVSAKWGVIAAPRLSPTPSEFKPGVQWKPKAELERDDRQSSDETKEITDQEYDAKTAQDNAVNGMSLSSEKVPPAGIIRPPPGLGSSSTFELQSNTSEPSVGLPEKTLMPQEQFSQRWLSLTGLKPTVDFNALRLFCQQYGIVHVFRPEQVATYICYDNPTQALAACQAINGRFLFDSSITATLIGDDQVPAASDSPSVGLPAQPQPKPFVHNQFPGMQPRAFWDQNGQIGTMNPNMPFHPPPPPHQSMAGMPSNDLLGLGAHLGQWPAGRSDPLMNHLPYWPVNVQPQGLLNPAQGYGPWSATSGPRGTVTTTHNAVSPSTGTKLLLDGGF